MKGAQARGEASTSAEGRSHLARLCRGFLLAREQDPRQAEAFLISFLHELAPPQPPGGPPTPWNRRP